LTAPPDCCPASSFRGSSARRRALDCTDPIGRTSTPDAERGEMARSADSLSVFVVQRSFRRVMRGYDPDEVEHHLERVSQWFSETGARAAVREAEAQLSERERALREADEELQRRSDE